MHDVHDILPVAGAAVLFQQRRDGLAGGFDVDGLEVALGVSIIAIAIVSHEMQQVFLMVSLVM